MRIESVTLSGFRCFGPEAITVPIAAEITAVVGPNAAGKTALLYALATLFGVTRAQRTVQRTDFHMGTDDDPDDREAKNLFIDVLIGLPELDDGTATPETIAPSFRHMQIEREGKTPVCRMRLEARWEDDGTIDGEVSQDLFWVEAAGAMSNMAMPEGSKMGKGSGTVTAADAVTGKITLDHGAIQAVGWPAMKMGFSAKPDLLKGVAVGDKVDFNLTVSGSAGEVTASRKH